MTNNLTSIDLFAGCGGLSLGLEQAGFETIFVNELNPHAMESFLINRESFPHLKDEKNHAFDLLEITQNPKVLKGLRKRLHKEFGDIGVISGGPPCQGYSGIGHRSTFKELNVKKEAIPTNHLYKDMAKFVEALAPRAFIFENVRGLLSARKTAQGKPGEFWEDVKKEFTSIRAVPAGNQEAFRYVVQSKLLLAKDYGVPQNRPRVIMIGIREDVHGQLPISVKENTKDSFYPPKTKEAPDPIDVLEDLIDDDYLGVSSTTEYPKEADLNNKYLRNLRRKSRTGDVAKKGDALTEHEYSMHSPKIVRKFKLLHKSNKPLLGTEQKELANQRCRRYIEYKNESETLKERFVDDFTPLFKKDELKEMRDQFSSANEKIRYIKILDRVEQEVINHIGVEPHKKWIEASEKEKLKIKKNFDKLKENKEYEIDVLKGKKLSDFQPLPVSTVFQIEKIAKELKPSKTLREEIEKQISGTSPSKNWENLRSEEQEKILHNLRKIQVKKKYQAKFAQRPLPERWDENGPNITITGGTEDLIHFSQPRTLTVREWARLQGFPDWYQFAGPRTTGGRRRAGDPSKGDWTRDLPKYTQIGNAVPVKLAAEIGTHLKELII